MADAATASPPAVEAPAELSLEDEVNQVLGFGDVDSNAEADKIAARAATNPQPGAQPAAEAGGGVGSAPAAPPEQQPAGSEPAPQPAAAQPSATPPAPAASEPSAAQPAAPPAQQPPSAEALRAQSLEAQVDALTQQLEQLRSKPAQGQQPDQPQSGQPQEQLVSYGLTIPPQVAEALDSDDGQVRVAAINKIVNDFGTIVHNSVVRQMRAEVSGMFQALVNGATQGSEQQQREAAAASAKDAYYQAFPDHNNAVILPIVQTEAAKMAAEFPHLKWGPDYINALGARVNAALDSLRGVQPIAQQPEPQPGQSPAQRPAAMMPTGNRQPQNMVELSGEDLIMDTLDPFGS